MNDFNIKSINPYDLKSNLIRYGNQGDGGYVIDKNFLHLSTVLYSYGVSNDVSFEKDFLIENPDLKVHLYDHTITDFPYINSNVHNHFEGLSLGKTENCNNFLNHLKENNDENSKVFLKIDVETAELEYFSSVNLERFNNVVQMVIEFHFCEPPQTLKYIECIKNINKYFYCIHIHGNNCCGFVNINNVNVCCVSEYTYVNKNYVNFVPELKKTSYPIENLDFKNLPERDGEWKIEF
jgi:hypothetical protein